MTDPDRWKRIEDVFARACELPVDQRVAFVTAECAGDAALAAEITSLLADAPDAAASLKGIISRGVDDLNAVGRLVGGRFAVEGMLGSGGMGTVYVAVDRQAHVRVALKQLPPVRNADDEQRFEREARVLAGLVHPNIVRYVAHGTDPAHGPFLAMEWLEGEDLATRLERAPLTVGDSLRLARQVALALACAHDQGVIHRDIKPSNLWLTNGKPTAVKLLDFGIARVHGAASLTRTNAVLGTIGYMAPEQARGEKHIDHKADLFSLGCLIYECVTGIGAFAGDHHVAVLVKLLHDEPTPIHHLRPELPRALDTLVSELLAKKPVDRPADAHAVIAALDAIGDIDAATPPRQTTEAATTTSERVLQLLLVDPKVFSSLGERTLSSSQGRRALAAIERATARMRAVITPLRIGMVVVMLPERADPHERAEAAAAAALAIIAVLPEARIAIAADLAEPGRVARKSVIDRCAAVFDIVGSGQIGLDDATARLLEERYVVESTASGTRLLAGAR